MLIVLEWVEAYTKGVPQFSIFTLKLEFVVDPTLHDRQVYNLSL